jgi:MFS family permease
MASLITPQRQHFGMPRTFRALRQRNFRLFWFGQLVSAMGSWMESIGLAWLVLELTHSAWQLGVVVGLPMLPVLLFSLFAGVFADRWPKRSVLLATQSAALIQALLLWVLVVTESIQIWQIYLLALLMGLTTCLDRPTRQAFVIEMAGRKALPNAVALSSSLSQLARIAGPGLAGIVIAAAGVAPLFLLNALSYFAVILGLALMNTRELHVQPVWHADGSVRKNTWQSLREGLGYVWQTPAVSLVIVVVGLVLLFGANFGVVLPLFATDVLHVGAAGFGFLAAAIGAGSLIAALWLAWSNRRPTIRGMLIGSLVFVILEVAFALSHFYPLSVTLIAGVGMAEIAFAELAVSWLQIVVPDHLRGRVMSVQVVFFDGSVPLGYLMTGWLAERYGASIAVLAGALLSLLVVGAGWIWQRAPGKDIAESAS